jgi:uncharacterized membrane protein
MRRLASYFFRGLIFVAPLAVTVYVCVRTFTAIDGWLGLPVRGLGFVVTILAITLIGFLASTILAKSLVSAVDGVMNRLPLVRLLYSATKDLLNAFVGEQPRFNAPVLVPLGGGPARALGFVTQPSLDQLGLVDYVTVYIPFSYSISGRLLVFPASAVLPVRAASPDVLAFIVSGGVTDVPNVLSTAIAAARAAPGDPSPYREVTKSAD